MSRRRTPSSRSMCRIPQTATRQGASPTSLKRPTSRSPKTSSSPGIFAFVSATDRIFVFDISDPASPDSVGVFSCRPGAEEMVVFRDYST